MLDWDSAPSKKSDKLFFFWSEIIEIRYDLAKWTGKIIILWEYMTQFFFFWGGAVFQRFCGLSKFSRNLEDCRPLYEIFYMVPALYRK